MRSLYNKDPINEDSGIIIIFVLYMIYIKELTDLLIPSFVYLYFTFCNIRSHKTAGKCFKSIRKYS